MLRSVRLVIDAACETRVVRRALQLPLAGDAHISVASVLDHRSTDVRAGLDLVVLGTRSRTQVSRLLGRIPLLVVNEQRAERYRRVLVAVDDSTRARELLQFTCDVFGTTGAEMSAVSAYRRFGEQTRRRVAGMFDSLGRAGAGWTRFIAYGDVFEVVQEAARETRADLLVVGARPRSRLRRLLFGSLCMDMIAGASSDVLAVPTSGRRQMFRIAGAVEAR